MSQVINKYAEKWFRGLAEAATEASVHMDPQQLTEYQAFAIAALSGVPYHSIPTDEPNALQFETEPCGICVVDGKWRVISLAKPQGGPG